MRGLLGSIIGKDTTSSANPASWLVDWVRGGEPTLSGQRVTPDSSMSLSAVWVCVRIRSEDIGKVPCFLYRRLPNGGKERATGHPLYNLIRDQPNPYQTALEFKQLLQAWVDLRGNGYALKEYDARGQIVALWPLNPTWVTVLRVAGSGELFYDLRIPGEPGQIVPSEAILHLRGLTLDGYVGVSPITYHRETIGLAIAAEKYGAAFFGNSAQPNGALKVPTTLSKEAGDTLRSQWEQKYRGVDNAKKLAIFDGGMEWVQTGMANTDAEYLATRKFQNLQIYSLYRVPPHKAGELEGATHSNIEQQALEYVADCLMTEMVRWEQTLKRDLLSAQDIKDGYFFEFMPDALLRGDLASRYGAYAIARNWGWLNVDEIRDKENMNPVPNGKGKIFLQPLNMAEAGAPPPQVPGGKPPGSTPATQVPGSDSEAPTPDVSGKSISADGARHLLALAKILVARDQPRVPAGSPDGGQFAPGSGGGLGLAPNAQDPRQSADAQGPVRNIITESGITQVPAGSNDIVEHYKGSGYHGLNKALREGTKIEGDEAITRDTLDRLLGGAAPLDKDIIVYRGIGFSGADRLSGIASMADSAFVSTSLNPHVAAGFAGHSFDPERQPGIVRIRIPAGSRAVLLGDTETAPMYESEVLLPRDSMFSIGSESKVKINETTVRVFDAELKGFQTGRSLKAVHTVIAVTGADRFGWSSLDEVRDVEER